MHFYVFFHVSWVFVTHAFYLLALGIYRHLLNKRDCVLTKGFLARSGMPSLLPHAVDPNVSADQVSYQGADHTSAKAKQNTASNKRTRGLSPGKPHVR